MSLSEWLEHLPTNDVPATINAADIIRLAEEISAGPTGLTHISITVDELVRFWRPRRWRKAKGWRRHVRREKAAARR